MLAPPPRQRPAALRPRPAADLALQRPARDEPPLGAWGDLAGCRDLCPIVPSSPFFKCLRHDFPSPDPAFFLKS